MALFMLVGVVTTLCLEEPKINKKNILRINEHVKFLFVLRFFCNFKGFLRLFKVLLEAVRCL